MIGKLFSIGQIVYSQEVSFAVSGEDMNDNQREPLDAFKYLRRHGSLESDDCAEDQQFNEEAVESGARILTGHNDEVWGRVWVITEADRSVTTVLFPHEY